MKTIQEVFKQFCKERYEEDKRLHHGRNFNTMQSIYAYTEFFDMEFLGSSFPELTNFSYSLKKGKADFPIKNFSLPFQNIFVHHSGDCYVFLREYAPNIITGTIYGLNYEYGLKKGKLIAIGNLNLPFTIFLSDNYPMVSHPSIVIDYSWIKEEFENPMEEIGSAESDLETILHICTVLNDLLHKTVAVDKPKNPNMYEYYNRKKAPAIKVPQRPIYYVLGEKNENVSNKYSKIRVTGSLEYSYSFHVRGHWRRIDEKTYGKDRNGNYNVAGYTWVNEYMKGEGELVKRIRVIK